MKIAFQISRILDCTFDVDVPQFGEKALTNAFRPSTTRNCTRVGYSRGSEMKK